jgi:hypothetical protein
MSGIGEIEDASQVVRMMGATDAVKEYLSDPTTVCTGFLPTNQVSVKAVPHVKVQTAPSFAQYSTSCNCLVLQCCLAAGYANDTLTSICGCQPPLPSHLATDTLQFASP